jgi:hypothetical protein
MKNVIELEYENATRLCIRIKDEMRERMDEALAGETLHLRTREGFAVAAISWALSNLRANQELTMMGLEDGDHS